MPIVNLSLPPCDIEVLRYLSVISHMETNPSTEYTFNELRIKRPQQRLEIEQ